MDTIGDMLTTIRNGYRARKEVVLIPHSKLKEEIAKKLEKTGSVGNVSIETDDKFKLLKIKLNYDKGNPAVIHIKRVSTPGLRVYRSKKNIKPVLRGMGFTLISTSKGIMTNSESVKSGVGGEVVCEVW